MNSFAHYSFGAVARWMFQSVAGIDTDGPGFKRLLIHPQPEKGLTWVKASYRSLHGLIESEWKIEGQDGPRWVFHLTVPANTAATVYVPASNVGNVTVDGRPPANVEGVKFLRQEAGAVVCEVRAGKYEFVVRHDHVFQTWIAK
jgi:alpha-L-rhamnosidase